MHFKPLLVKSGSIVVEQLTLDSEPNGLNTAATAPGERKEQKKYLKHFGQQRYLRGRTIDS
jgi:hypothetical protein